MAIIYQEFNLLPERTVAENVFLGREPTRHGLVDIARDGAPHGGAARARSARLASARATLVRELSIAQQQVVEIVKALSLDARLLVMDEPTAALAEHEVEVLFTLLRRLRERGHRHALHLPPPARDLPTCRPDHGAQGRRAGRHPGDRRRRPPPSWSRMMVGRELDGYFPPRGTPEELGDVRLRGRRRDHARCSTTSSIEVRAGEIVGLAGLQGSGRTELARALFGADTVQRGDRRGRRQARPAAAPRAGDRAGIGLRHRGPQARGPRARPAGPRQRPAGAPVARRQAAAAAARTRSASQELARSVELRARSLEQEVRFLSGGNQQKVVLAKWLAIAAAAS